MKTRTFSTRSGKRVKPTIPAAETTAERARRAESPHRHGRRDVAKRRGVAICSARKCKLPPGHDDGVHEKARKMPRVVRRWAKGQRWTTKKGDQKPARPSGVALASPNCRKGRAQRAGLGLLPNA